jgi:hypothetical protein
VVREVVERGWRGGREVSSYFITGFERSLTQNLDTFGTIASNHSAESETF